MATLQATMELEGLQLEELDADLSELTIDLQEAVTAQQLATLLKGLADLYKLGVSLDDPKHDPFVSFGSETVAGRTTATSFYSSADLFISKLEIGTPNKLKVIGRTSIIKDLYVLVVTIGLAKSIFFPAPPVQPPPDPPAIVMAAPSDYMDAINSNLRMRQELDEQFRGGGMPLRDYQERQAALATALRDITEGMQVARTRPAP